MQCTQGNTDREHLVEYRHRHTSTGKQEAGAGCVGRCLSLSRHFHHHHKGSLPEQRVQLRLHDHSQNKGFFIPCKTSDYGLPLTDCLE